MFMVRAHLDISVSMDYHPFHDYNRYPEEHDTIPAEIGRRLGIKPGYRLDWQPVEGKEEILVRVHPGSRRVGAPIARRRTEIRAGTRLGS